MFLGSAFAAEYHCPLPIRLSSVCHWDAWAGALSGCAPQSHRIDPNQRSAE
jgi:hypothetical protein